MIIFALKKDTYILKKKRKQTIKGKIPFHKSFSNNNAGIFSLTGVNVFNEKKKVPDFNNQSSLAGLVFFGFVSSNSFK